MIKKIYYADIIGASIYQGSWESNVHSIYSKAVNFLHPSGNLISIVDSFDNMTDFGLVVTDFSLLISKMSTNSHFVWERSQIIFSNIVVDLSRASEWSGILNGDCLEIFPDIGSLTSAFNKFASDEGLSPILTNKSGNIYSNAAGKLLEKAIKEAVGEFNISDGLLIDLSPLVGMGIGFTPSGDDFLTGLMLYETMSGVKIINRENIRDKLSGTTEGGRTLLFLAFRDSFPSYLKQFAEAISINNFSSQVVVQQALKHGSTSGSDALTGFLWASKKYKKYKKTTELI